MGGSGGAVVAGYVGQLLGRAGRAKGGPLRAGLRVVHQASQLDIPASFGHGMSRPGTLRKAGRDPKLQRKQSRVRKGAILIGKAVITQQGGGWGLGGRHSTLGPVLI